MGEHPQRLAEDDAVDLGGEDGAVRRFSQAAAQDRPIEHAGKFSSPGLTRFFAMLAEELDEDYFRVVEEHVRGAQAGGWDR